MTKQEELWLEQAREIKEMDYLDGKLVEVWSEKWNSFVLTEAK